MSKHYLIDRMKSFVEFRIIAVELKEKEFADELKTFTREENEPHWWNYTCWLQEAHAALGELRWVQAMLDGRDMPKCENCDKDVIEIGATYCSLKCASEHLAQQQSKGQEDAN